ncbi:MAG TPA: TonB-dependent receptor [Polyangiales bacterium]
MLFLLGLLALLWLPPSARADGEADEAEINFQLGAERYQTGDYRAALAFFLASQRLSPNRNVRFNIVRTFQRLGMHAEAYRWCEEALAEETDPATRAQLSQQLELIQRDVAVIEVKSEPPGATIYVDRVELGSLGRTPARLALSEGEHRVILELDGHQRSEPLVVRAEKHKLQTVSARLVRIVGEVRVVADQPTEVRVDQQSAELECVTPCSLKLSPGPHLLFFRRPGYRVPAQQVRPLTGSSIEVRAEGVPLTGTLLVTTDVRDALVEIDGSARGFTPVVVDRVPVGKRKVRVSLAGYEPLAREVEVQEGTSVQLSNLTLTPRQQVTAAARMDQSVDEAPASVSVVSRYELEAFRYPTIAEALRGQRGVATSTDSVYNSIALRGLGQPGDYGNRVLVLSDGATLNDNIVWQSYVGYDGRVDLGGLSRIELVRGPGSVLYGTGALTGLVNLVSQPVPDRPQGELRIQANDARSARARAAYAQPFGKRGGVSISASGAHSSGYPLRLDTEDGPVSVEGVERFNAATGQLRARYGDLALQGLFSWRQQDVPAGAYGAVPNHPDQNFVKDARGLLELRYEPELIKRRLRLYARTFGNLYHFDSTQLFPGEAAAEPQADTETKERYRGYWWGAEVRLLGTISERVRLTGGAEVQVNPTASLYGVSTLGSSSQQTLSDNSPYQIYAGYALLDVTLSRMVTLSAGARVDAWSTFGATPNPRLNLVIRPSPSHVVKLVAGRAFRAPSIYELRYRDASTQQPSTYMGNKLGPELAWSGEAEYTFRFLQQWALVTAVHCQYAEALIEHTPTEPGAAGTVDYYYDNSPDSALTVGGDIEVRRELYAGLMFASSYSYLYARYVGEAPQGSVRLPNAPAHYAAFRLVIPVWAETRLALRSALEAPRRISDETTKRTSTAVITDVVFSGYLGRSGFDFAVGVYNLFDFRVGMPTDPTFLTRTMPQPGRTLLVSLGLVLQ